MEIKNKKVKAEGIKIFIKKNSKEVARAFLYLMKNDLRKDPFGYLEDIFVDEKLRGQKIGTKLLKEVIKEAKKQKCYKIVATSRFERENIHKWYEKHGFKKFGVEFKMYLKK